MIPLRDDNPTIRRPVATYVLIGANLVAFVLLQGLAFEPMLTRSICRFGLIPGELLGSVEPGSLIRLGPQALCQLGDGWTYLTPLTSMFMHGGWFHIIGNMWFLHVFGDNVEDAMGSVRFALFYMICGLAAAAAQILTNTQSLVPMVGASGAIGGVMGAYALLYPKTRVHTLLILGFIITTASIPAVVMLGYWFLIQVIGGLPGMGAGHGGVAFWAHVGGFLAGLALIKLFVVPEYVREHRQQQRVQVVYRR